MSAPIKTFRNVRVLLRRGKTGEWIAGWVTHLARDEARIRLWNYLPLDPGESLAGECYGQGTVARFNGKMLAQAGPDLAIEIAGSISYAPSEETPRICAAGLVGKLETRDGTATMQVVDVSPLSLGAFVDAIYEPGAELTMELSTEMGPIAARVSVANCRTEGGIADHYRVGLHILDMARLDRARWGRLVSERAEA